MKDGTLFASGPSGIGVAGVRAEDGGANASVPAATIAERHQLRHFVPATGKN
jgi:hypothetical protein